MESEGWRGGFSFDLVIPETVPGIYLFFPNKHYLCLALLLENQFVCLLAYLFVCSFSFGWVEEREETERAGRKVIFILQNCKSLGPGRNCRTPGVSNI